MCVGAPLEAQPALISSTDTSPCHGCTLALDSITTIGRGQNEGEYFARETIGAVVTNGRVWVISTLPLQVFDLAGHFVAGLGRIGQGPGEFPGWLDNISISPAHEVYAFSGLKTVVYDSTLRLLRQITLASRSLRVAVLTDGKVAGLNRPPTSSTRVLGSLPTPADYARTFAEPLFRVFSPTGSLLRPVGTTLAVADQIITAGTAGTVWTAKKAPYEIKQWAQDGTLLRAINRVTPFFDGSAWAGPYRSSDGGDATNVVVIRQDSRGRLWTVIGVAKHNWKELERAGKYCCESIVEILDPLTGELLASARIAAQVRFLMDDGYLGAIADGPSGEPLLVLYRARLTLPGR
jgi:hypothetical protein